MMNRYAKKNEQIRQEKSTDTLKEMNRYAKRKVGSR